MQHLHLIETSRMVEIGLDLLLKGQNSVNIVPDK